MEVDFYPWFFMGINISRELISWKPNAYNVKEELLSSSEIIFFSSSLFISYVTSSFSSIFCGYLFICSHNLCIYSNFCISTTLCDFFPLIYYREVINASWWTFCKVLCETICASPPYIWRRPLTHYYTRIDVLRMAYVPIFSSIFNNTWSD